MEDYSPQSKKKHKKGEIIIKKLITGISVIILLFTSVLIYNHNNQPTIDDVYRITRNWSPQTEEVYLIRKIEGKWLTIFRNQHSIIIGELKKNWFGLWDIRDEIEGQSSLVSTYYPPEKGDDVTWGASVVEGNEITYYFGQIVNIDIQKIKIETKENNFEDIPLIIAGGNRFFFKKVNSQMVEPINIQGFSKSGKLIFSSHQNLSN